MAIDLDIINYVHQYIGDREIFDAEMLWLGLNIVVASAPPTITERVPPWLMKALNMITLHWSNSKRSDVNGKRKF